MRLKKLILQGFKSFADRTEFVFDAPITGVVGPNGCGKSNVVDAFKWVLGEQSAKSLRGEAMLDVIFNGSSARKPSGMAEVTLVFENPTRLDGQRVLNLDVDEVSVGRRLFRDGTSEYQINNHSSRLKDVRELFLDTGVGVDAYSVIEQGRVSALLEANPDERRLIFEEAAGISKFKQRKKESQRKLEKVDQNLLRVNDIVVEVEKRLRGVKVQAGKARTYQEYSTRLAELRLASSLHEYHTHTARLGQLTADRDDAQFRLDDVTGELQHAQNALAGEREKHESLGQSRQRSEYELVQAKAQLQSARQRQQYARNQLAQVAEQLAGFEQDRAALERRLAGVAASLDAEAQMLAALTDELAGQRRQIDERQAAFHDGQLALNAIAKEIDQHKSAVLDLMRKIASANNRLGAIEIERRNIAAQQNRTEQRRQTVLAEAEKLEAARADLQRKLDAVVARLADEQQQLEARRAESQHLGKRIAAFGEKLGAAKEHRSALLSRQKVLKDLESKREGVSEGVKSVLRQREQKFPFVRGLVADLLRVDVEHAHVIEAALDGRDQWLICDDSTALASARESLAKLEGRVNFVCADRLRGGAVAYDWNRHPQGVRLAIDLVRFDPADRGIAGHLLGDTLFVEDLADASALASAGPAGFRFVTRAGEIVESDGTLRAGPLTAAMGLLSRRSELDALAGQIADADAKIESLSRQLSETSAAARSIEEQVGNLRNATYQSNTSKVELTSGLARNADAANGLRREQPVLERELQQFQDNLARLAAEEAELREQRAAYEADQAARQRAADEQTAEQKRTSEALRECGEQLTAARVRAGQVQEKQLASRAQVQRMTAAKAELAQQIERLVQSVSGVTSKRPNLEHELQAAAHQEATLVETQKSHESKLTELAAALKEAGEAVAGLARKVDAARESREQVEAELHGLQIALGEVNVRVETLVARTLEELQLDLPARYAEATAGGAAYVPESLDWAAVGDEMKLLREKINRLGNVNVDAIGEQAELEGRQKFLADQVADLASAKKQLEDLIDQINVESSARFEATFNAVREHFQGMFRKLFGGGKADVYLETELDPPAKPEFDASGQAMLPVRRKIDVLDAGIEIVARPPGKQPATISQLSGGEKTMTCIALLMSIFKSKPSPFCILDEVDAALDEANNQRFNLIVQEFLEQSQFIIITHSKRTMQIADVLYGVTMQEQGVSKKVAVKFDQVDAHGRIAADAADDEDPLERRSRGAELATA